MKSVTNLAPIFLGAALLCVSGQVMAKPAKHRAAKGTIETQASPSEVDMGRGTAAIAAAAKAAQAPQAVRRGKKQAAVQAAATANVVPSFGGGDLVTEARRYLGGNPTGRNSLWCGAFMDMVLKKTGHKGGGNLARAYAQYGHRISGPQVGAIAVMARRGGGHVGVVSGVDASGNPIIISGNHNDKVAEATYPASRIIAYVMPN
jgi:uncharacterized protein (TIGR02594 family)